MNATHDAFDLPERLAPGFLARLEKDSKAWRVRCWGVLEVPNATVEVQSRLLALHEAALAARIPLVELDVSDVEYMNSSGLKSFMAWFLAAANTRGGAYAIRVGYDPARRWQQISLRPMERLAPDTVRLVPAGG
jgi:hypothetical protein